jgi:hypothetical protein
MSLVTPRLCTNLLFRWMKECGESKVLLPHVFRHVKVS